MNTLLEQKKKLSETNTLLEEKHEEIIQQSEELRIISEKLKVSNLDLELKVKKRTKKLNKALDDSMKAEKLIASFLSNMSHEIRTPMNAISGFSQLIAQTDISIEQREHYNSIINQSVDSLLEQIDNIMHVSKMHSGMYVMQNNIFSLNTLLKELFADFNSRKELQKPNVLLRWQYPEVSNNIKLFADKLVFKQIVHQLVSNALKYTEKGEVVFGCQLQQKAQNNTGFYRIADKKTQNHEAILTIFVKDTGVGIDKKQQQYIFDAFKKIEVKEKLFRGTGLGLAIVKSLCDAINAKIELKSELNKGSIFTIKLALLNN
jgi:two-component system sensor histidine kinase EvgS